MREAVPGSASVPSDPSVFSIGQHMENNMVNSTTADVGKIQQDMNAKQLRFNKISLEDFRNKSNNKPWKPEVTPPRRRGGFSRGRGDRQFNMCSKMTDLRIMIVMVVKMGVLVREMGMVLLEIEDRAEKILEVHCMVRVKDEVGSTKIQMFNGQE